MESIHDNNIHSIEIKCDEQYIVLHTEFLNGESKEFTDIRFNGVVGHLFENVLPGNILQSIEHCPPTDFYKNNKQLIQNYGRYGLPLSTTTAETFTKEISQKNLKIFVIYSSYGLSGWVIGTNIELIKRNKKQA